MADLLFAASLEPPSSLTFLSTHYSFSPRRPASLRFSALKKHHATADSGDFGIVSSKEHSDGSVVFLFGDVHEIVDDALVEPESRSDVNSVEVRDEVDHNPKEEIKSAVRRKHRRKKIKVMGKGNSKEGFNNLRDEAVEKETNAVTTMDVDEYGDQVGAYESGFAHEGDFISVSDEEKVGEDVSAVRESGDHAELAYRPSSTDSEIEVRDVEHPHLSVASRDGEENAFSKFVGEDGASDGNADGVVVAPVESKVELKGSMTDTADGSVNQHVTETSCMQSDDSSASSFWKHNGTDSAAGSRDLATTELLNQLELQMGGASLERDAVSREGFHLSSAASSLPHPFKAFAGGDDLFFVTGNWIGVADGINLWSFQGTSSGQYTRELMENCQKLISDNIGPEIDPVEVLSRSLMETQSIGASTALLAFFDHQVLHVVNIGDSGFIVIRDGKVFKKSSPMVHAFSFPIRLQKGDDPSECAEVYKVNLDEGDCIIIATDGLFDNLHELEIASIVSKSLEDRLRPQEIAELLVARAQEVGESASARTPYSDDAQAAGYVGYRGGKLDAVTVIVSLVEREREREREVIQVPPTISSISFDSSKCQSGTVLL